MRFLTRSLTGLLLFALTLALIGLAVLAVGSAVRQSFESDGPGRPPQERVVAAHVTTIALEVVTPVLTAYGRVEARRRLDVRTTQGGTVVHVADSFRNGLAVTEGEVLLRLDPAPASEALALAEADLSEATASSAEAVEAVTLAEADLAAAEVQASLRQQALARQQEIETRGLGSPQAVETAELAVSSAEQSVLSRRQALATASATVNQSAVAVTRAKIALGEAQRALEETELRAGLSGRVDGVTLVPGAVLGANEVVGRIIDPEALDVAVRLSAAQFARLLGEGGALPDGAVEVLPGGAGSGLAGRVDRVSAAVAEGQTGRLVYVALDPAPGLATRVQPGDFVTVTIEEPPVADAVTLPATALGRTGTLLVIGPEDRLEELLVEVVARQGDAVIVAAGALAGREVVTERSAFLGDGIRIRPLRSEAPGLVTLTPERRAALAALVEASDTMSETEKAVLLQALQEESVPAGMIESLERRMDG